MAKAAVGLRFVALASVGALALAGCGGSDSKSASGGETGGTLTFLTSADKLQHIDPQRVYTGEDQGFLSSFTSRSLTTFKSSPDGAVAGQLVGDLATDIGKSDDGGKTWAFQLRPGVKWEDGSAVTCEDIKYGISRTFAQTVITDGPVTAIASLDVPTKDDEPVYKGPYETKNNDTAAYDKAVQCAPDGTSITFKLAAPQGDFNYATTFTAFGPVPKAKDTGEGYDKKILSNGPYKITKYAEDQELVLERNPNWSKDSNPIRKAYPDKIVMKFGVEDQEVDQRMQEDSGDDQRTASRDRLQTESLSTVFNDERFANRRIDVFDIFTTYIAINTKLVPELKHRQAIMAATDRAALRTIAGGKFGGDLADGAIKPNLAADYAPTGLWDTLLGEKVPDEGNVELAKRLIAESGKPMPELTYQYTKTPTADKSAAAFKTGLARAGIKVTLAGLPEGDYYTAVEDDSKAKHLMLSGWGQDWPNASTIVPELFASFGAFNLSRAKDSAFDAKAKAAKEETDRAKQSAAWKELNTEAVKNAWIVPTRFSREQRLVGSKIRTGAGPNNQIYMWEPFGSFPYGDMYVAGGSS